MLGTYNRLDVSVWASNRQVIKAASKVLMKKVRTARHCREARHKFYREILECHQMARNLVVRFRL